MDRKDWTDMMFSVQAWYDIAYRSLIDRHRADAETKRKGESDGLVEVAVGVEPGGRPAPGERRPRG